MEPLRQRFQNFGPTGTLASKISEFWTYWNPCVRLSTVSSRRSGGSGGSNLNLRTSFSVNLRFFGVRRGLKMIVSHRPLTSLDMSPYRPIWTHFTPISICFIHLIPKICRHLGHVFSHSPRIPHRSTTDLGEIHHN